MNFATQICESRFSFVEAVAEGSQKDHDKIKVAAEELDQIFEEFVRSWQFFRREYNKTKEKLLRGELRDTENTGRGIQKTIAIGLKAASPLKIILEDLRAQGHHLKHARDFVQAQEDLNALNKKMREHWPFVDHQMVAESRAAFMRGESQSIEELLDEFQSSHREAS